MPRSGCRASRSRTVDTHLIDFDSAYEDSVSDIYPDAVKVGWIEYDVASAIKSDPVSWDLAKSEWIDAELSDGVLVAFDNGSTYHRVADVEQMIADLAPDS